MALDKYIFESILLIFLFIFENTIFISVKNKVVHESIKLPWVQEEACLGS